MCQENRKVYMTAGYQTVSLGTGRKEFNPKKPRPGLEEYIREAGQGVLKQIGGGANVDEGVISNFMAARFNRQGNLAALIPYIDPALRWKPCVRVEGACGSGGLGLMTGIKSVLAATADVVLAVGVEVQNTVKADLRRGHPGRRGLVPGRTQEGPCLFLPRGVQRPGRRLFRADTAGSGRARRSPAGTGTPSRTPASARPPRNSTTRPGTSRRRP